MSRYHELEAMGARELASPAQAREAVALLRAYAARPQAFAGPGVTPFCHATRVFERYGDLETRAVLRMALPLLVRLYDRERDDGEPGDLLGALRMFAWYGGRAALARIAQGARRLDPDHPGWARVLDDLVFFHVPEARQLVRTLMRRPPGGSLLVALLAAANRLARDHGMRPHAFDTPAGHARLRRWLTEGTRASAPRARTAVASLRFLGKGRTALLAAAARHRDLEVRLEAGRLAGDPAAIRRLRAWALDPITRTRALAALDELGEPTPEVPRRERAALEAMTELAGQLSHPLYLGHLPDRLELLAHRRLPWPPTGETRDLWVIRYRAGRQRGVGVVGAALVLLPDETDASMTAAEVLRRHRARES
jgi:hypothetical protein